MKFVVLLLPTVLLAQTGGKVSGVVINSVTNDPVGKAFVMLRAGPAGVHHTALAGADGRFLIDDVEPGPYDVSAIRTGFTVDRSKGIRVAEGGVVRDLIVKVVPHGLITGRMIDEDGDPVRGSVAAMQFSYVNGKRELQERARATPNVEGEFRLFSLRPGTYYLQGTPRESTVARPNVGSLRSPRLPGLVPTYFPATVDVSRAIPIQVAPGAQIRGIDVKVQRVMLYAIRATVPDSKLGPRGVWLRRADAGSTRQIVKLFRRSGNDGSVEVDEVVPGQYVILGGQGEETKRTYAHQFVRVDHADVDVGILKFTPAVEVSGKLLNHPPLGITLEPESAAAFSSPAVLPAADGTFTLRDIAPDVYLIRVAQQQGAYPRSFRFGEKELSDNRIDLTGEIPPLTITMATDTGHIEGNVRTADGSPAVRVVVCAVPAREDLYRWTMTNDQGKFVLSGIAPVEYNVFAWEDVDQGAPRSEEFRKPFESKGTAVKLDPGGRVTVELQAIR